MARKQVLSLHEQLSEQESHQDKDDEMDCDADDYERGEVFTLERKLRAARQGPVFVSGLTNHTCNEALEAARIAWSRMGQDGDGSEVPENPEDIREYFESKVCVKVAQRMLGTAGYYHTLDGQILVIEELATMQGFGIGIFGPKNLSI